MLTKTEFLQKLKKLNNPYWERSKHIRWKYMKVVLDELKIIQPQTALEVGTNKVSLLPFSDSMDLTIKEVDPDNINNINYIQDAKKTPWKIDSKYYDVVIALQVFEHLGPKQSKIFKEIKRTAKYCILTLPYKWKCPDDPEHHMITDEVIEKWTNGEVPYKKQLLSGGRIMLCYKF